MTIHLLNADASNAEIAVFVMTISLLVVAALWLLSIKIIGGKVKNNTDTMNVIFNAWTVGVEALINRGDRLNGRLEMLQQTLVAGGYRLTAAFNATKIEIDKLSTSLEPIGEQLFFLNKGMDTYGDNVASSLDALSTQLNELPLHRKIAESIDKLLNDLCNSIDDHATVVSDMSTKIYAAFLTKEKPEEKAEKVDFSVLATSSIKKCTDSTQKEEQKAKDDANNDADKQTDKTIAEKQGWVEYCDYSIISHERCASARFDIRPELVIQSSIRNIDDTLSLSYDILRHTLQQQYMIRNIPITAIKIETNNDNRYQFTVELKSGKLIPMVALVVPSQALLLDEELKAKRLAQNSEKKAVPVEQTTVTPCPRLTVYNIGNQINTEEDIKKRLAPLISKEVRLVVPPSTTFTDIKMCVRNALLTHYNINSGGAYSRLVIVQIKNDDEQCIWAVNLTCGHSPTEFVVPFEACCDKTK